MSATERTLAYLRAQGYHVAVVEKRVVGITIDAFGFIDILAYKADDPMVVAVQSTTGSNHAAHLRKYEAKPLVLERIKDWIAHRKFLIISWSKTGPRGKRKLWTPRVEEITPKWICESMAKIGVTSPTKSEVVGSSPITSEGV